MKRTKVQHFTEYVNLLSTRIRLPSLHNIPGFRSFIRNLEPPKWQDKFLASKSYREWREWQRACAYALSAVACKETAVNMVYEDMWLLIDIMIEIKKQ